MNRVRYLIAVVAATVVAAALAFANMAQAQGRPAPVEDHLPPPAPVAPSSGGLDSWQVVIIAAIVVVLVALVVGRVVYWWRHRRGQLSTA